jgi:hypothetical protein
METVEPGEVTVLAGEHTASAPTFSAHGHHFAMVDVEGLPAGSHLPYEVRVNGRTVWPAPRTMFPPSALRTLDHAEPLRIVFGTCRSSVPHDRRTNRRYGVDVLRSLALRLANGGVPEPTDSIHDGWPSLLLFLGDQVYADETSDSMREYISHHRDLDDPPGEELADFGEYAHLYRLAWSEPTVRWVMSTVPSAMMFDDHDVRDDWNTSQAWRETMRATEWWRGRHRGRPGVVLDLPAPGQPVAGERADDPLWQKMQASVGQDVGALLDEFAGAAEDDPEAYRWSYSRELGRTRLIVIDSRAARVTEPERRAMLDPVETRWLDERVQGDVDHLAARDIDPLPAADGAALPGGLERGSGRGCLGPSRDRRGRGCASDVRPRALERLPAVVPRGAGDGRAGVIGQARQAAGDGDVPVRRRPSLVPVGR